MENVLVKESTAGNVWKYIFEDEKSIVETVLYKYNSFNERTVICCSVQSGCPVGCTFCGTGKNFVKNLTKEEIVNQIKYVFEANNIKINIWTINNKDQLYNFTNKGLKIVTSDDTLWKE